MKTMSGIQGQGSRWHKSYLAALAHRLSGLALALFLPVHFLLLGTALNDEAGFSAAIAFTSHPLVKIAEWGLVIFLSLHLLLGLRVLALEMTRWPDRRDGRTAWIVPAIVIALLVGLLFWIQV